MFGLCVHVHPFDIYTQFFVSPFAAGTVGRKKIAHGNGIPTKSIPYAGVHTEKRELCPLYKGFDFIGMDGWMLDIW